MQKLLTDLKEVLQIAGNTSFAFKLGLELECYVTSSQISAEKLLMKLQQETASFSYCDVTLVPEEGEGQYELVFAPQTNIHAYIEEVKRLKHALMTWQEHGETLLNFAAKPFCDQPASALHVHVSMWSQDTGKNLFVPRDEEKESEYLLWSVAGLLEALPRSMALFAPCEVDYLRYQSPDRNTPSTISWGGENRTVALRIPAVGECVEETRIEHRVPSPMADIEQVVAVILHSILLGIEAKQLPMTDKIFGNAWDEQYDLPALPDFSSAAGLS